MDPVMAGRVALARLFAQRFGRDVPLEALQDELERMGVPRDDVAALLDALVERRLAIRTAQGWRPTSPPVATRAREGQASFAWLHA